MTNRTSPVPALDFAARQRAATRELVSAYSTGSGPVVAGGLDSIERSLAVLDAASAKPAPLPEPVKVPASETASSASSATPDPLADFDTLLAFYGIDPVALREANPVAYLALGSAYVFDLAQMQLSVLALARAVSECRPYVAAPGARNALRHSLYQTGVISDSDDL